MILKTGFHLMLCSTLDFFYVNSNFAYAEHPVLRWACMAGLAASLVCFAMTYVRSMPMKARAPRDLVRWPAWKASSTH